MPYLECADCKEVKTGRQQEHPRCGSCGIKGNTNTKGKTRSQESKDKMRAARVGKTASLETRAKMSASRTGKIQTLEHRQNNSLTQGGNGDILNRRYPGIRRWTRLVKERDGHKCAECSFQGTKGDGFMDAHHVIPKSKSPELATVLFNGVTLCKPCHKEIHAAS